MGECREEGCEDELEIYQDTDVVVTDSGVRIPKTVMIKFLQSLKPELPAMPGKVDTKSLRNKFLDPNLPKPYKFNPVKDNNRLYGWQDFFSFLHFQFLKNPKPLIVEQFNKILY